MGSAHSRAAAFSAILLLFVTFHSVAAQRTGARVRVVIAGDTLTGDVIERRETGFTMALHLGIMSDTDVQRDIEFAKVEKLEVRSCCTDYAWLLAAGGGGLLGALVGEATNEETCSHGNVDLRIAELGIGFGVGGCTRTNNEAWGGLIGAAVGLVVGLAGLRDRWEVIPHGDPGSPSLTPLVGIRPDYGGTAMILGMRVRF